MGRVAVILAITKPGVAKPVYMRASKGPFRCDHCEYYRSANRCDNKVIIERAKKGLDELTFEDGLAVVEPGSCSDEYWPREKR